MYDILIFIGRFQPFHREHNRVINEALKQAKKVLVLVGSAGSARNIRNPFTFEERKLMITWNHDERVIVKPLFDKTYNNTAWTKQVQHTLKETVLDIINNGCFRTHGLDDVKVGLIGAAKDHTSYYLKLFPQWGSVNVSLDHVIHATDIRENYLTNGGVSSELVPDGTYQFLVNKFFGSVEHNILCRELEHSRKYKKTWEAAPYPVKHITVDAVVEQSGHILLVKRKSFPGQGLWALPGGHLEEYEALEDGVIRELREETGLKVPTPVLRGSIKSTHMFDDPHRSNIGRVITFAQHIKLTDDVNLPRVKGADDAEKAKWVPIDSIEECRMFDDHFHIINYFLGAE